MKLQWSIQSSYTQIAWKRFISLVKMNVYDSSSKCLHWLKVFHLDYIYFFILLINTTQFLCIDTMKFLISLWRIGLRPWHHTAWIHFAPPFPILTSFWSKAFLAHSFFKDWCLKSFLTLKIINVRRYIKSSLHMY